MNLLTLFIVVLGVCLLGLLRLRKAEVAWAKPAVLVCSIALIGLAGARILSSSGARTAGEIMAHYEKYQAICGDVLGTILADRHPGARVVILTPPKITPSIMTQNEKAMLEGLKGSLERGRLIVTVKSGKPPRMSANEEAELLAGIDGLNMSPEEKVEYLAAMRKSTALGELIDLGRVLAGLKGQADVVICMMDGIFPLQDSALPEKGNGPALVMLDVDVLNAEPLLQRTVLDTVVRKRRGPDAWTPEAGIPKNKREAFSKGYELITADNL